MFYTYKHTLAIQLLALLDADYNFIYVHVGCQGRIGDAGVFHHSSLSKALAQDTLGIPDRTLLPNSSTQCSYTLLADEAFPPDDTSNETVCQTWINCPRENFQLPSVQGALCSGERLWHLGSQIQNISAASPSTSV